MIYLDYNATTPCDEKVVNAMLPYFTDKFGNASSSTHPMGWTAAEAVKIAKNQVAKLIVFTSGATEACNLAIKGWFELQMLFEKQSPGTSKKNHIITCATEHSAVLDTCNNLSLKYGAEVTHLPVDRNGDIDMNELANCIKKETLLIAIMFANNETGVLHNIAQIATLAYEHQVALFTDATQAVGKIAIDVRKMPIGMLAFSGHKIYGPKGVGALFVRRKQPRIRLVEQINGGGHEHELRSGTLNVTGIVGFGKSADICSQLIESEKLRIEELRNYFEDELRKLFTINVHGSTSKWGRLAHVSNLSIQGIKASRLISAVNHSLAFSVGSACNAAKAKPSHVLQAIGLTVEDLNGAMRFSLGRHTSKEQLDQAIQIIKNASQTL
jgi:cysteine desulfurase